MAKKAKPKVAVKKSKSPAKVGAKASTDLPSKVISKNAPQKGAASKKQTNSKKILGEATKEEISKTANNSHNFSEEKTVISRKSSVETKKMTRAEVAALKIATLENAKWQDYKNKYGQQKAPAYTMSGNYEVNTGIQHKLLGWGFILNIQNDRLEVIFETGSKILISNFKQN